MSCSLVAKVKVGNTVYVASLYVWNEMNLVNKPNVQNSRRGVLDPEMYRVVPPSFTNQPTYTHSATQFYDFGMNLCAKC